MKKLLAILLCATMLISMFAIAAAAEDEEPPYEQPEGWNRFGDITIHYDSSLKDTIVFDGKFDDWTAAGIESNDIDYYNMDSWAGTAGGVPEDFAIHTYFGADAEYLYIAFNILDDTKVSVADGTASGSYGGVDAFQIQLDFSHAFGAAEMFDRGVFYSFGRRDDGQMCITVQESAVNDGEYWANAEDEETGKVYVKGACTELEGGWGAEFALSWQMLYKQANDKLIENDESTEGLNFELGPDQELTLGALVCYLNYAPKAEGEGNDLVCASGTCKWYGQMGTGEGFYPENSGINLRVQAEEVITVDIQTESQEETTVAEETSAEEKTTVAEETTAEETTVAENTTAAEGTTAEESTTAAQPSGCKSVAGIGAIAVVAMLGIGAVALKKKEN